MGKKKYRNNWGFSRNVYRNNSYCSSCKTWTPHYAISGSSYFNLICLKCGKNAHTHHITKSKRPNTRNISYRNNYRRT